MKRVAISLLLLVSLIGNIFSQATLCENSNPFCTSDIYTFPAGTGGTAQSGPDYGCLVTQPNPAWYHMKIAVAGNIDIEMFSTPSEDIDFICWGPFSDPYNPCTSSLTNNMIIDCSYSIVSVETCQIPDGQVNEYYILLITNYSDDPCDITFQKIGGSGETDCSIVPPPVSNNGPICVHDDLELYADNVDNATYLWTGPESFTSTQQNPVISDVGLENAGVYSLVITVNGTSSDPVETIVIINALPSSDFTFSDICFGETTFFTDQSTVDPPSSSITTWNWNFGDGQQATGQNQTHIYTSAGDFNVTLNTYTGSMQCESTITKLVTIYNNPNVNAGNDITIPYGTATQLNGSVAGGSGNYIFDWQPSEKLEDNTIEDPITLNLIETTPFTMTVEDESNYCVSSDEVVVIIDGGAMSLTIIADNNSVCSGDPTIIEAVATDGSGDYTYAWTSDPPGINFSTRIITVTPDVTTTYFVEVNDGYTTLTDQITITVLPSPIAEAGENITITTGSVTQLDGEISGGSGNYNILWQPENLLEDPTIIDPTTIQLWTTQVFTLYITDSDYGCIDSDDMTVIVTGDLLQATVIASPSKICQGDIVNLNALPTGGSGVYEYIWTSIPIGFTSNIKEPSDFPQVTTTYTVSVFDGLNTVEASVTVEVNPIPIANAGDDISIFNGWTTQLDGTISGGSGVYEILWEPEDKLNNSAILDPTTVQLWASETFTLNVSDSEGCSNTDDMTVIVTGGALQVTATADPMIICQNDIVNLNALPVGGSGNNEYTWTSDPVGFTASIREPSDFPMTTTIYTISVFDGQNTAESSVTVEVKPKPIGNAGEDITINIGTSTTINGSAANGGSGEYNYAWSPSNILINPTSLHPQTVVLNENRELTLIVNDVNGCSSIADNMFILLDGDELSLYPTSSAIDNTICQKEDVNLFPNALGGSGSYIYTWYDGTGYYSSIESPNINPMETTTYTIEVSDSFLTITDSITIHVKHLPIVDLIPPDATIWSIDTIKTCVRDTIRLNAGTDPLNPPEMEYLWSTAATTQSIVSSTNGSWVAFETYWANAKDPFTGCTGKDTLTVFFDFQECDIGVKENISLSKYITVMPNPAFDDVNVSVFGLSGDLRISLANIQGQKIWQKDILDNSNELIETISLKHLPKGIYIICVVNKLGVFNTKIIKR